MDMSRLPSGVRRRLTLLFDCQRRVRSIRGVSEEDPDAPDAFRFAAPGKLAGILEKAGAENMIERQLNFQIEAPSSFEQFWQLRTEMSESLREKRLA